MSFYCLPHQSSILLELKQEFKLDEPDGTFDSGYPKMRDWKAGTDCCFWRGVSCDMATGHVVSLDLSSSLLGGPLHSNSSLFSLLHLQNLNLAYNYFSSSPIPSEFGQLSRLTHLNLSGSWFSGPIPSEILRLTNLISIDLSCYFGAPFPCYEDLGDYYPNIQDPELLRRLAENITSLRKLDLGGLNFSSKVPDSLGNLSSLTHLFLYGCNLHGDFPKAIFRLPNLQSVNLRDNHDVTGSLSEFHSGRNLLSLELSSTNFGGKLPYSIGNLTSVNVLDLRNCKFSGPVPNSLGNLANIIQLHLDSNEFSSEIPSSLGNLTQLIDLVLSNNFFHGSLPISLPYLLDNIDFRNNSFTGPVPFQTFSNLTLLRTLDLSSNLLNGVIPSSLLSSASLHDLFLDDNQFTDLESLSSISTQLECLSLYRNKLEGSIPSSIFKLKNLTSLFLGSNSFSGRVDLGIFSELSELRDLDLSYNALSLTTNVSTNISALPKFRNLVLSSCNITEFPDFLKAQNELETLDLSHNILGGPIPKWFLDMSIMSLNSLSLSHNFISGWQETPAVLPWIVLSYLDLSSNMLQGPLVPPMSTSYFFVSNNNLTGPIDLLFCNISFEVFDASNNHLGGTIPQCFDNLDGYLTVLNLRRNNFQGNIPQFCRTSDRLITLDLSHNQLYGNIPRSLIKCKDLQVLNLGHNQISDTFPFWLQNLQQLRVLILCSNKFQGPICCAHDFVGFMTLKILDLSHNGFFGNLPSDYFRNWTSMILSANASKNPFELEQEPYNVSVSIINKGLEMELVKITLMAFISIDLSNNKFDGEIPSSLWCLRSIVMLNLSSNNFSGHIPSSLGNLIELESLDLSNNELSGKIPQQLTALTFLGYLNFSQNQLVGPIPQGGQVQTFPDSFEGNMGLCGLPLSRKCETPTPSSNDHYNEKSDFISGFGWKAVVIGYGCGLLIGMVAGHVISSRRPDLFFKVFRVRLQRGN
ncbi:receptor-like protein 7 [Ziziphus jujuba]|uniref:Receptor-like protein 7 n=1 Tax=Ziziphus jujuba TaxID=326968 RepID=A0ABM3IWW2_ZIZJJ|nr:receptor-like protein 7 [Ziziphus jujuba]